MPEIGDPRAFLAVLGVLVLIFTVFRMGRRRAARVAREAAEQESGLTARTHRESSSGPTAMPLGKSGTLGKSTPLAAAAEAQRASEDLSQVLVQIQEVTREVEARLDTRIRYARRMMEDAEKTLDALDQMLHEARGILSAGEEPPSRRIPPATAAAAYRTRQPAAPVKAQPPHAAVKTQTVPAASPSATSEVPTPGRPTPVEPPMPESRPESRPEPRPEQASTSSEIDRIGRLAAQGKTPAAIAREIDRPIGEVELMLGLHRQANDENSP